MVNKTDLEVIMNFKQIVQKFTEKTSIQDQSTFKQN